MTDLATRPDADEPSTDSVDTIVSDTAAATQTLEQAQPTLAWAPAEPAPAKKRRLWLWIGVPAALVVGGVAAASLVLIAPGTSVAGVPVGFMTAGAATEAIEQRLAETTVTLGEGGPTLTGTELGAGVDARALADAAFAERPAWNVTQWFGDPASAEISLNEDAATTALRTALPDAFVEPTPATVAFADKKFAVTPAVDGAGVDVAPISAALSEAFTAGQTATTVEVATLPIASVATTDAAQEVADKANAMLKNIGFYVGEERTVPVSAKTASEWITIASDDMGTFSISADAAKIQDVVDGLKEKVDQKPINGTAITNSAGTVLSTVKESQDGRVLGDTAGVATAFAAQIADGKGKFALPVEVTEAKTATLARMLEVDLSEQRLYVKENGAVVDSWPISSGLAESPTYTGRYTIGWRTPSQTMRSTSETDPYWNYEVENVQWVMYFNGDQAFHGVYWHNDFGNPRSHGCVGMPNWRAQQIYNWAPGGVDVYIHN